MRSLLFLLFFAEAGLQLRGENEHKDTLEEDKDTLNSLATYIPAKIHAGMARVQELLDDAAGATRRGVAAAGEDVTRAAAKLEAVGAKVGTATEAEAAALRAEADQGVAELHAAIARLEGVKSGSSFIETGDGSVAVATDARGEAMTDQQLMELGRKADLTKLKRDVEDINKRALEALAYQPPAPPTASSFLESSDEAAEEASAEDAAAEAVEDEAADESESSAATKAMDAKMAAWAQEFEDIKNEGLKNLDAIAGVPPHPTIHFDDIEKKIHALEVLTGVKTAPASFVQRDHAVTFQEVAAKIAALGKQVAAQDPAGAASSFVEEEGASFAEADAKLAALRSQTSAALAALPSSLLEEDPSSGRDWDKKFRAMEEQSAEDLKKMEKDAPAPDVDDAPQAPSSLIELGEVPSSFVETGSAEARAGALAGILMGKAQDQASVQEFNQDTDSQFAALRQKLKALRAQPAESLLQEKAEVSPGASAPTWEEDHSLAQKNIETMREFTERNKAEIEALRNHHTVASALDIGAQREASAAVDAAALTAGTSR